MRTAYLAWMILVGFAVTAQVGCSFDPYCINCADEDGGGNDASAIDGGADEDALYDASEPPDACIPSGIEVCDGIDNDCNGDIDDGDLAGVGAVCSSDVGECVEGVTECTGGDIVCSGVLPSIEICDGLDNDCNNTPDDGNPGGGAYCGTDVGECVSGITQCTGGDVNCVGNYDGDIEACNGLDDDCDNEFDEDIPPGAACGPTEGNEGECALGQEQCIGGEMQCVGAVHPALEQCDALDHDCDGDPLNGFDFPNDAMNCGAAGDVAACGNVCANNFTVGSPHVTAVWCNAGTCAIALCETDYWNNNTTYEDGCEFGPCTFQSSVDMCNLHDDDCDGAEDEDAVAPDICDPDGECANPPDSGTPLVPTCTAAGWVCDYDSHPGGGVVSTDGDNHIVAETQCDGRDNDCDGVDDESFPLLGTVCHDAGLGVCQKDGLYICNAGGDDVECDIDPLSGGTAGPEACNGLDDNCDGTVDNGWTTGSLHDWIDIGNGLEIFAYEATRPDATPTSIGADETYPCSRADALPWTNVRHPDAEAACTAIGARLCSEFEWQTACAALTWPTSPAAQGAGPDFLVVLEAEYHDVNTAQGGDSWIPDFTAGYSGVGVMRSDPDDGDNRDRAAAIANSPRLDFQVDFDETGTHYVWVRGWAPDGDGNRCHVGVDLAIPATSDNVGDFANDQWEWEGGSDIYFTVPATGERTVSLWMREDGLRVDKIIITTNSSYTPSGLGPGAAGCGWAYENNCDTYQDVVCNGNDYDPIPGDPDDDLMTYTGEMNQCFADLGGSSHIFDMSGNVKEWTAERTAGVNPTRGGAFNTPGLGLRCDEEFPVADDTFFFPNLGFRCCR